ncbi:MAG: DUF2259 domain-containing protein [Brucellaceae bacterium]|nr:DUF2259 domain-containing protein [Brucellaceae bacterium]
MPNILLRPLGFAAMGAVALGGSASAGDFAELNILGFSADGAVFAFEQYGVQDGSGFPLRGALYIDTGDDSFVAGTPIRVRIDDENASVEDARAQARSAGQAIVADSILAANRGFTAGFNAPTEQSADPWRMAVNPRPVEPPVDTPLEVRLEEKTFPSPGSCPEEIVKGFTLTLIDPLPGGVTRLLADDTSVPSSRACPNGYRIGGIQTFHPQAGTPVFATIIAVRSFGFEGPDYRWMAVTAPVDAMAAK